MRISKLNSNYLRVSFVSNSFSFLLTHSLTHFLTYPLFHWLSCFPHNAQLFLMSNYTYSFRFCQSIPVLALSLVIQVVVSDFLFLYKIKCLMTAYKEMVHWFKTSFLFFVNTTMCSLTLYCPVLNFVKLEYQVGFLKPFLSLF